MWTARSEKSDGARGIRFAVEFDSQPASCLAVIQAWQHDAEFRSLFNSWLSDVPYSAFRWETPPATRTTAHRPFEFVVLDDPALVRKHDPKPFAEHFTDDSSGVATFPNLSGDATLVVPCPVGDAAAYGHHGAFVRLAPEPQRDALWAAVGTAKARRVGTKPVWLSTAGAGVAWLHVQLDGRPKYY